MGRCASLVALASVLATSACSFPRDGVSLTGDPPDAEVIPVDAGAGDAGPGPDAVGMPDATTPPDATTCVPVDEVCNGLDDDCDGDVDDGVSPGTPCDGPDGDLCLDDTLVCDGTGALVCSSGAGNVEACNAADDDCDGTIDEGFGVGTRCDGADGDLCREGEVACTPDGTGAVCTDTSSTDAELCNLEDDDCDLAFDEGFDVLTDVDNCGACGIQCANAAGSTSCVGGTCAPVCDPGAATCGLPSEGCTVIDTDPACVDTVPADLTIPGDAGGSTGTSAASTMGTAEAWVKVQVTETLSGGGASVVPLTAVLRLSSSPSARFTMTVTCTSCGGTSVPVVTGMDGTVTAAVQRPDAVGSQTFDLLVGITWVSGGSCSPWTLSVAGNVPTMGALTTCP